MIIDSNIIIHFLRGDVPGQFSRTVEFFHKVENDTGKGEISILVMNEIIWALGSQYKQERSNFIPSLIKILTLKGISIIETKKDLIIEILKKMIGNKIDFTDYYLSSLAPKSQIFSFDEDFKKLS